MKRLLLITIAVLTISTIECQAQSWLDMLKNAATTALDKVTGGQLSAKAIVGTWNYAKPGVRLTSKDNMSEITAAALTSTIQEKLVAYYEKAGIKAGVIKITMKEDGTFSLSDSQYEQIVSMFGQNFADEFKKLWDCVDAVQKGQRPICTVKTAMAAVLNLTIIICFVAFNNQTFFLTISHNHFN